jgi:hypothetical protein
MFVRELDEAVTRLAVELSFAQRRRSPSDDDDVQSAQNMTLPHATSPKATARPPGEKEVDIR